MVRSLLTMGPSGWRDLFRAQMAVVRWSLRKRFRPPGRLVARRPTRNPDPAPPPAEVLGRAQDLALAVDRVARKGPVRAKCLVRSLALRDLLQREGLDGAELRFGVRSRPDGFRAHAWVDFRGEVLGDDPEHVATFRIVPEIDVPEQL